MVLASQEQVRRSTFTTTAFVQHHTTPHPMTMNKIFHPWKRPRMVPPHSTVIPVMEKNYRIITLLLLHHPHQYRPQFPNNLAQTAPCHNNNYNSRYKYQFLLIIQIHPTFPLSPKLHLRNSFLELTPVDRVQQKISQNSNRKLTVIAVVGPVHLQGTGEALVW